MNLSLAFDIDKDKLTFLMLNLPIFTEFYDTHTNQANEDMTSIFYEFIEKFNSIKEMATCGEEREFKV